MEPVVFRMREQDYLAWLLENPTGFVINTRAALSKEYMALHRASCSKIQETKIGAAPDASTGQAYRKVCAHDLDTLFNWIKAVGALPWQPCKFCSPISSSLETKQTAAELNGAIKPNHLDESLRVAQLVLAGKMSPSAGARFLNKHAVIKLGSAKIIITVYGHLRRGEPFKRTLSAQDLNFFLAALADEGYEALEAGLQALDLHIKYRMESGINPRLNKALLIKYKMTLEDMDTSSLRSPITFAILEEEFRSMVEEARALSRATRLKRLAQAPRIPRKVAKLVYVYVRNANVVAEVLDRADGTCERCSESAPFLRAADGSPYLEVHHRVPLSENGEDTVENAMALCPNCHREFHHGKILVERGSDGHACP